MQLAIEQARKGLGRTRPNPAVGAVVVKGTRIVATGYHRKAGMPHGEAEALAAAGQTARGATLYVTLEPCCHTGRTGPCTQAVIAAGIKRVVVGCRDANPIVDGAGIAALRRAGIAVEVGCLQDECEAMNRAFSCWIKHRRPLVTMKFAATLDGVIGQSLPRATTPAPVFITSKASLAMAHQLRAEHHAILVGQGTLVADDPQLTVRTRRLPPGGSAAILRVVLDTHLRTSSNARLLRPNEDGAPPPLFLAGEPEKADRTAFLQRKAALEAVGAEVELVPAGPHGVALAPALRVLAKRGVQSLLVEGGSRVHGAFVAARLVDRVAAFVAPKLAGGGVPVVTGPGVGLATPLPLRHLHVQTMGPDLLITADVAQAAPTLRTRK